MGNRDADLSKTGNKCNLSWHIELNNMIWATQSINKYLELRLFQYSNTRTVFLQGDDAVHEEAQRNVISARDAPSSARDRRDHQTSVPNFLKSLEEFLNFFWCSPERSWSTGGFGHEHAVFSRARRAAVAVLCSSAERWVDEHISSARAASVEWARFTRSPSSCGDLLVS